MFHSGYHDKELWWRLPLADSKLKGRHWSKQIYSEIEDVSHITSICCELHNMHKVHEDNFNEEWLKGGGAQMAQPMIVDQQPQAQEHKCHWWRGSTRHTD